MDTVVGKIIIVTRLLYRFIEVDKLRCIKPIPDLIFTNERIIAMVS